MPMPSFSVGVARAVSVTPVGLVQEVLSTRATWPSVLVLLLWWWVLVARRSTLCPPVVLPATPLGGRAATPASMAKRRLVEAVGVVLAGKRRDPLPVQSMHRMWDPASRVAVEAAASLAHLARPASPVRAPRVAMVRWGRSLLKPATQVLSAHPIRSFSVIYRHHVSYHFLFLSQLLLPMQEGAAAAPVILALRPPAPPQ